MYSLEFRVPDSNHGKFWYIAGSGLKFELLKRARRLKQPAGLNLDLQVVKFILILRRKLMGDYKINSFVPHFENTVYKEIA